MRLGGRAAALSAALLQACGDNTCGPADAVVARVIDGDTIELAGGERVRYLLIDAPETSAARKPECYGAEARAFNRTLVENRSVQLRYDEPCSDHFGRLLAFVFVDGQSVSELLVQRGYACVLHIPPSGDAQVSKLTSLETQAAAGRRGLWGYCNANPCR
ncbi:MAG TPA: thermonuclease family protein [Polyangiaceae bacterium]|nr:thermonuclease family protein [Polyangiaceae bacterium]